MSDKVIDRHLKIIMKKQITAIYCYPSAIYFLACYAEKEKLRLPSLRLINTTGEILPDEYRKKIISVFECNLIDSYGASDGGLAAFESAPGIYKVGYNCIVEIENKSAHNGQGKILATDLFNYAQPFIHYEMGDEICLLDHARSKNYYNGQIITKIWGRDLDIIRLENGHVLMGMAFTGFFRTLNIFAFRITKVGKMHIECMLQKNQNYRQDEENLIRSTFKEQAGDECKISFKYVENFEEIYSGKRNYFISNY
jgi:phenylacetate-CoA ligase